jgi:hypothetical protein
MCADMGLASHPRFQLCAYLVSPGLRPTFILAAALTADPAKPRLVLALDYRGLKRLHPIVFRLLL